MHGRYTRKVWQCRGHQIVVHKVKYARKAHVWGCFCSSWFFNIHIFEENLNAKNVQNLQESSPSPVSCLFPGRSRDWCLQEDNDPKHTSKLCRNRKEKNKITTLSWPARSPDLNPIKNVWGLLKMKVAEHRVSSVKGLKRAIRQEWNALSTKYALKLVESLPRRLEKFCEARSDYTLY